MTNHLPPDMAEAATRETSHAAEPSTPRRRARALIGWMSDEKARHTLAGRTRSSREPAIMQQAQQAREAVARRAPSLDIENTLSDIPPELVDHVATLQTKPEFDLYRRDGWQVKIADLRKVCALQEIVHLDHVHQRFGDMEPTVVRVNYLGRSASIILAGEARDV